MFKKTRFDKLTGLNMLVTFHRMTGNTYFNSNFNIVTKLKRIFLFIISVSYFTIQVLCTTYFILFIRTGVDGKTVNNSQKTIMLNALFNIAVISLIMDTIFAQYIVIFRGKRILTFLKDQNNLEITNRREKRIGIKIILIQISLLLLLESVYLIFVVILSITTQQSDSPTVFLIYTFLSLTAVNFKLSIVSLMAYQSFSVAEKLRQITESFHSLSQIDSIVKILQKLQVSWPDNHMLTNQILGESIFSGVKLFHRAIQKITF